MEFMYCIPDLEVFIDKTIKKCLLEYDLDANDTEAVLDDMEKAWPKSPQKSPHDNVTKDCNGNTKNGRVSLDPFYTSKFEGAAFSNMRLDTQAKDCHSVTTNNYKDSGERLNSNEDLSTPNGLVKSSPVGGDCSRSDTSSPDAGECKLQKQRHSKLKSRLQQRYFEGSSPTAPPPQGDAPAGLYETGDNLTPNNLHLLASAANLHTRRSIGAGVDVAGASGYLKGQATMSLMYPATKSFPQGSSGEPGLFIGLPARSELLSPLSSSSLGPEFHGSNGGAVAAGLHPLSGVVTKQQETPATVPGLGFPDSQQKVFGGVQLLGHKTNGLSLKGKTAHWEAASSSDLKVVETHGSPTGNGIMGIHCSEEGVASRGLSDHACASTEEKARRLFELYQKGYHSVIPRDVLVVREELSPGSEIKYLADKTTIPGLSSSSQTGSLEVKQMKKRLSPSSDGGHFQNKSTAKQLISRSQTSDFDFRKKRQLSSGSGNRDLGVKKMRKQLPYFPNKGNLEVRKGHNQEEIRHSSSSLTTSDQRPVSAPNYYHLASQSNGLEYTHQHSSGLKPGGFLNQQHYYTSRIASIIVEELEKDTHPEIAPTTIPSAHRLSPDNPPYFGLSDSRSSGLKSNNTLPCNFQFSLSQNKKSISLINDGSLLFENIPKSVPQILPAHTARPSHNSLSALLAFNLGQSADVKNHKVKGSFYGGDKSGAARDDNNQPEDLSIRSNNNIQNQDMPVNPVSAKSSPNPAAVEDQSHGYFSSPTSPLITSQSGCHVQLSQVLLKPSSSPLQNHKQEIKYSSDSEAATSSHKTLGNWEKKGQVHGLGIAAKGNSKAVEKRRAETLKTYSTPAEGHGRKSKTPQTDGIIAELHRCCNN